MKTYKFLVAAFFMAAITTSSVSAQKEPSAKAMAIKNAVDSQQYVFTAEYAHPMRGGQRYLTSQYTVTVSKDKIIADLPYFGQSSSAPMPGSEGGIHFTSTNFTYSATAGKKGGWEVTIKPQDANETSQITISIYNNGTALLNVTSVHRDPISFNGRVK